MITIVGAPTSYALDIYDYCIIEKSSGIDELEFDIPLQHQLYPKIAEEVPILADDQRYLIKAIDAGMDSAKVLCQIDLDDWRQTMMMSYINNSATIYNTVNQILPSGWSIDDQSGVTIRRTIESEAATPMDVLELCRSPYGITYRFDAQNKIITIINPESFEPVGAFASKELNLKELNYKGKSSDFSTRLYAYGKDGLSFANINGGLPYVDDHTYSSKVICAPVWTDDRYTVAENLLADAKKKLAALAVPQRSYECSVIDLANTNPELYSFQDFSLHQVIILIDDISRAQINHQVVERRNYPHYPDRNEITLSTVAPSIQSTVKGLQTQVNNTNSDLRQQVQANIKTMSEAITGALGGNVIIHAGDDGKPAEILIMDTPDKSTATNVLRMNMGGIATSTSGYDGPFNGIMGLDGRWSANYISTWTLESPNGKCVIDLSTGTCKMTGSYTSEWDDVSGNHCKIVVDPFGVTFTTNGYHRGSMYLNSSGECDIGAATILLHYRDFDGTGDAAKVIAWMGDDRKSYISIDNLVVDGKTASWQTADINGQTIHYLGY